MKVIILGNFPIYSFSSELGISDESISRITTWNENLAFELSKINGLEVIFITSTKLLKKSKVVNKNGLKVYFLVFPPKINILTLYYYCYFKVKSIINSHTPDIVHGIGTEHFWPKIAVNSKYKNIITLHGILHEFNKNEKLPLFSLSSYLKKYFEFLEKKILASKQNIISINPYVKSISNKIYKGHIYYDIPNAISPIFKKYNANVEKSNQILFIGNFEVRKNIGLLLDSLNELDKKFDHNYKLKIIGKVKDNHYYEFVLSKISNSLRNKIDITPFMFPSQIANEMAKSSMLVLTSLNETAPMVIAEAMTVGLPVVATNVGGVSYMINHKQNGFVVDGDSIDQLSYWISELLLKADLRKKIGSEARKYALSQYDAEIVAQKTYNAYLKTLEK